MYGSQWWFDTRYFWIDYPVTDYTEAFKYYYLVQFAYWLQQIFVLQIEAPRKDYRELVMHHINTLLLIFASYFCNFTRVGNAVFVCMDLPDAVLAVSKQMCFWIRKKKKNKRGFSGSSHSSPFSCIVIIARQSIELHLPWNYLQCHLCYDVSLLDVYSGLSLWMHHAINMD